LGERGLDVHPGDPAREVFRAIHPEVPEYEKRLQDRRPEEVPMVGAAHSARRVVEA
jgi:hypothetical protein